MDQLRNIGRNIPGTTVSADVQSPLGGGGGFGGGGLASINLQLAGPDLDTLNQVSDEVLATLSTICLLYTSPSPRDGLLSRMPSSA